MPRARRAGLGTRVALRTFIAFGLSALLPVVLFAIVGYAIVTRELESSARQRLQDASKRYGVLLNERLIQTETMMLEFARVRLADDRDPAGLVAAADTDSLLRIESLTELGAGDAPPARAVPVTEIALPPGWRVTRALDVDVSGRSPHVRLRLDVTTDAQRRFALVANPAGRAFWNAESMALPGAQLCVLVQERTLSCEADGPIIEQSRALLHGSWTLFLKPRYGSADWIVRAEQPKAVAYASLRAFRIGVPLVALLAIAVALLLSSLHIRRSHRPLAVLAAAAHRMSRGQFGEPVRIATDDEYGAVGRAFDRLGARLRRQFGMLATLARLDRQILARPTLEPVVRTLLPRMPRMLGCELAAVLVQPADAGAPQLLLYRPRASAEVQAHAVAGAEQLIASLATATALEQHALLQGLEPLVACAGDIARWQVAPIRAEGRVRGVLLAGHVTPRLRRGVRRAFVGLAHRLAVALGNEDRERALIRQAYYDTLTTLPNRQLFRDRLEQELVRSRRDARQVALLFIDLDHFKHVNDSLGHSAGDALLRAVAERLRGEMRDADTLSRLGGDEFTVICPGATPAQAASIAARLLASLQAPLTIGEHRYVIQASIGVAVFPDDCGTAEDLLRCADGAMYRAKQSGRGRVAFFEEGMNAQAHRRLMLEQRLRAALDRGGLRLVYQPKFAAHDRSLHGLEALARWEEPGLGPVSPTEFIALAEETGLIERLGEWALNEACAALRRWNAAGIDVHHVAVNVSMKQLRDPQFAERVQACLDSHSLLPGQLELEITESTLAAEGGNVVACLEVLRRAGVRIAMDDFGTGYSSLAALRTLPVDVLKIDRSFIARSVDGSVDEALLRGLIELAHTLGKLVVAEGVETEPQMQLLRRLGCDVAQGYLLALPQTDAALPAFLREHVATGRSAA